MIPSSLSTQGWEKKISFREFFPLQYYFLLYLRDFGGHSAVLVLEVVFDGLGQVELGDFALLNSLLGDGLTNDTATKIQKWQRFSCKKKLNQFGDGKAGLINQ